ncbi:MAG TPA: transcriptional regulator NrdR [Kofleriaceae bacterium]|nr:transcriptional regulator NrdR [Kofleriaceae bacterium]
MRCPFCGEDEDKVNDSRQSKDGREIRRRRECLRCGRRFTTYERIEESMPMVVKRDGRREAFDRAKIERGLVHAVAKLPVSQEALRRLAEEMEREIGELGLDEIASRAIGERVLPRLRALDPVAYVRFASIYRDVRDLAGFARELEAIGAGAPAARAGARGGGEATGAGGGDGDEDGG